MALTGLNYYSNLVGLDTGTFSVYLDFNSPNELISNGNFYVKSPTWCPEVSGVLIGNSGEFNQTFGSGLFTGGRYLKIENNYPLDNWTVVTVFDYGLGVGTGATTGETHLQWSQPHQFFGNFHYLWSNVTSGSNSSGDFQYYSPYNKILFSCFQNGESGVNAANSGYFCGINAANKLFFSHWNTVDGPQIYTYTGFVPSKSIVLVNKQNNTLNLGIYDPNAGQFNLQQFDIYNSNIVTNGDWYIAGSPTKPTYYPNLSNFLGSIDEFILISGQTYQNFLDVLPSGFWNCPTGTVSGFSITTGEVVYPSGINYSYTGITGYQTIVIDSFIDACGNVQNVYGNSGILGLITGFSGQYITGIETITGFTGSYTQFQTDLGFFNSLGMEGITIFYEILSGNDTLEYFANSVNNINYSTSNDNFSPILSTTSNNYIVNNFYFPKSLPVYRNGQLQLESGYFSYPNGYSTAYILSGDYFLTGRQIESTGAFTSRDVMVYDYNPDISGTWASYFYNNTGSITPSQYWQDINNLFWNNSNIQVWNVWGSGTTASGYVPFSGMSGFYDFVYVNGQKLTSGVNINSSGQILLNLTGINVFTFIRLSGLNSFSPTYNQVIFDTGSVNTQKFLKNTSVVFYNGIRQSLYNDYVERGICDLITGEYRARNQNDSIYNNTQEFLNL